jgi:hypothetical protein
MLAKKMATAQCLQNIHVQEWRRTSRICKTRHPSIIVSVLLLPRSLGSYKMIWGKEDLPSRCNHQSLFYFI